MSDKEIQKIQPKIVKLPDTFHLGLPGELSQFDTRNTFNNLPFDRRPFDRTALIRQEREGPDLSRFFDKKISQLPESVLKEIEEKARTFMAEHHATPTWEQLFYITGNASPETATLLIL